MNSVQIIGRLTKDPTLTLSKGQKPIAIARFTVAVDRRFKRGDDSNTDYIPCIAFGKTAEFFNNYVRKGMKMAINGHIQTGNYVKDDGTKVYTMDVIADTTEFCESKSANKNDPKSSVSLGDGIDDFMAVDSDIDELPFS